ncbi:MAG TPA: DNA alkylation repair protein [Anaerolineales bacterium]|nr:DNA alkylation repair protein [Anaerolineales bacterium]
MEVSDVRSQIEVLLRQAGAAHKLAFAETNSADPDWPGWYAGYLSERMGGLLPLGLGANELRSLLVLADADHRVQAPDADWPAYYASFFLKRLTREGLFTSPDVSTRSSLGPPSASSRPSTDIAAINPVTLAADISRRIRSLAVQNTPSIRSVRKEFSRSLRRADASVVLDMARALLVTGEHRWVAYELVHEHDGAMCQINEAELEEFGRGIDSWWSADAFSLELAGPAWRERQVQDSLIEWWAGSPDRWWRRVALVSTVPLNSKARGGRGDPQRTLSVCEILVADRDEMVVKALSWALRELIPHDRQAVRVFLERHNAVVAARVKREVSSKLHTSLKNPRRRHHE